LRAVAREGAEPPCSKRNNCACCWHSPGTNFDNIRFGALGASHDYGETGSVGLLYSYRRAATDAGDPQREIKLYVQGKVERNQGLLAYVLKGYGNTSPDRGLGLLFTQGF
jgi:hypothetical protein